MDIPFISFKMPKKKVVEKQVTAADRRKLRFLSYVCSKKWFQRMGNLAGLSTEPEELNLEDSRSYLVRINYDSNLYEDAWNFMSELDHDFENIITEQRNITKIIASKFWHLRESDKKYPLSWVTNQVGRTSVENKMIKTDNKSLKEEEKKLKECLKEIKNLNSILKPYAKQIEAKKRAEKAFTSIGPKKSASNTLETVPEDFFEVLREIEEKKDQPISRFSQIAEEIPSSEDSKSDVSYLKSFVMREFSYGEATFKCDDEAPDSKVWNDDYLSDYIIDVYNKCF